MLGKSILLAAAAAISAVRADEYLGFNYGAHKTDGSVKVYEDFEKEFTLAQKLAGTQGKFNSARLYTMIQGPSKNDPISAIQAAIDTKTSLLLGIWCSAGQGLVTDEITALTKAIKQYGTDFTDLVVGLSVGSEDLYRISPMGVENESGIGAHPEQILSYISQVREALADTPLKNVPLGHVDTWTVWVNGSNKAVADALDWVGFDAYPYFQSTMANPIEAAYDLFWEAFENTEKATGKEVWITETGWPVTGKDMNLAKAGVEPAQQYWNEIGCDIFGKHKTWWYLLRDADPTPPTTPEFGVVGPDMKPYYDLSCKDVTPRVRSSSSSSVSSRATSTQASTQATRTPGMSTSSPLTFISTSTSLVPTEPPPEPTKSPPEPTSSIPPSSSSGSNPGPSSSSATSSSPSIPGSSLSVLEPSTTSISTSTTSSVSNADSTTFQTSSKKSSNSSSSTETGSTFAVETSSPTDTVADAAETTGASESGSGDAPSSAFVFKAAVGMVAAQAIAVAFLLL